MFKQKQISQKTDPSSNEGQLWSVVQGDRLKYQIDMKIKRIIMLLETEPLRNAKETAENKLVESENRSQSSTIQFLSMKLSEESSNLQIEKSQNQFREKRTFYQPLQLRHCQSKSEGGEDLDYHNRISEVPEEQEDDPEEGISQQKTQKRIAGAKQTKENFNFSFSQIVVSPQKNYNIIRKRSTTSPSCENYHYKGLKSYQDLRLIESQSFYLPKFRDQNQQVHQKQLCSVKKLMKDKIRGGQKKERKVISEQLKSAMKKDCQYILRKRRRETDSGLKLRQNLIAKFRYFMKKREPSMRF